jgi:hypothetical protein
MLFVADPGIEFTSPKELQTASQTTDSLPSVILIGRLRWSACTKYVVGLVSTLATRSIDRCL